MRTQALPAIGALCGLLTVVTAVPALKYADISENCGVTTVYVTVPPPTESISSASQLSNTPLVNYGGTGNPDFELHSTSTTHLTSTAHQTILVTRTVTGTGYTRTETAIVTYPTSFSLLAEFTLHSNTEDTYLTNTADALVASNPSMTIAPSIITSYGNQVYSFIAKKLQVACSGDLVTCPEASVVDSLASSSAGSTSVPPVVYVVQTLTVIPLETLPTVASSIDKVSVMANTLSSIEEITYMEGMAVSTPSTSSNVYATGPTGSASFIPYSGSYPKSGAGGWNTSVSFITANMDTASLGSIVTGVYSTFTADAVSGSGSATSGSSSVSINVANSFTLPNATSYLVAQAGFTKFSTSSTSSATATVPSSGGVHSLTALSLNISRTTFDLAWTDSRSETDLATSAVDAVQSTIMFSNTPLSFSASSATSSGFAQNISQIWTSSYSKTGLATFTMDAIRSTAIATSTSSDLSLATATVAWTESCTEMDSVTATADAVQTSVMVDALTSSSSSSPISVSYSPLWSPMNSTTTTTTSSSTTTSVYSSLIDFFVSSSMASKASFAAPTSSGFSTLSSSHPLESETSSGSAETSTSSSSESLSATAPTSASSLLPVDDGTESSVIEPSSTQSITTTSSILTFTTLTTSASSPKYTACGEQGPFTLNFDDIPPLAASDNSTAQPEPIFSPYHQFYFSDGFTIVPPPTDPYLPSSGRLLVEFLADNSSALGYTGSIGNGWTESLGCFNFNALGMSVGCDSTGYDCDWRFTGYRYNNVTKAVDQITTQKITTAACPGLSQCKLVPISLDSTFKSLTELHINVTVAGVEKIWWMDDLNLAWYDDSCGAESCREKHA